MIWLIRSKSVRTAGAYMWGAGTPQERSKAMRGRAIRVLLPLVVVGAAAAGVSMAATASKRAGSVTVQAAKSTSFGMVLVNQAGHTLYRYTLDHKGVNACTGGCAKLWPTLLLKGAAKPTAGNGASAGLIGTVPAANGTRMVTYAGFPLHLFSGDTKSGEAKGQGFQGKWFVVNTKGALVRQAVKASTSSGGATTTKKSSWG